MPKVLFSDAAVVIQENLRESVTFAELVLAVVTLHYLFPPPPQESLEWRRYLPALHLVLTMVQRKVLHVVGRYVMALRIDGYGWSCFLCRVNVSYIDDSGGIR